MTWLVWNEDPLEICRKYGIEMKEKWYKHKLEVVIETMNVRSVTSQDKQIMKYMGGDQMSLWYRRIKIFADNRFCLPLWWKSRCQRLRKNRTLPRFGTGVEKDSWEVKVIPVVIDAWVTTLIKSRSWLKEIGVETQITELQKTVLLHTAQILWKVLEV